MTATTPQDFAGKTVLVTGAGTGIGRAAALLFARRGAGVALAGRREDPLHAVVREIEAAGGTAAAFPADIADEGAVERLVAAVAERLGGLDAAFNNAGITGALAPIDQSTAEDLDAVVRVNLRGPWLLMRAEIALMRRQARGGAIVNTSSIASSGGTGGLSAYAASKGGLDAMIRPVAVEAGPAGIRVNNVSPAVTAGTQMTDAIPAEYRARIADHSALRRLASVEEVAAAAVWLASDAASFVTGQTLLVDGGYNIAGQR